MNREVQKVETPELKPAPKNTSIQALINKSVAEIGKALPSHMSAERICRIAATTLRKNPLLMECVPMTFIGALFQAAQLGLEPDVNGQCFILPYKKNKKTPDGWKSEYEAQFQVGYKGYVDLFYRSSRGGTLDFKAVHEKDEFDYEFGTNGYIKHKPALKDRGAAVAYYAVADIDGRKVFHVMSRDEVLDHAKKYSKNYDNKDNKFNSYSPWATAFDAMALKTVLFQLMKTLPLSAELQKAVSMDGTTKSKVSLDMELLPDENPYDDGEENPAPDMKKADVIPAGSVEAN
jgi:recombination protein RecT